MNEMPPAGAQHQWYLARDGQQYGPLAEAELLRFIELGHLHPNDLVWRDGFADWRPALAVFPPRKSPLSRPSSPGGSSPLGSTGSAQGPHTSPRGQPLQRSMHGPRSRP